MSIRVPTPNVSVVDLKFTAARPTTIAEVNDLLTKAANGPLKNILGFTNEALVSSDFNHDPHSAVAHLGLTKVQSDNMVQVVAWYDNEWGFSNRMADIAVIIGNTL